MQGHVPNKIQPNLSLASKILLCESSRFQESFHFELSSSYGIRLQVPFSDEIPFLDYHNK
jgi:hypothetical protein